MAEQTLAQRVRAKYPGEYDDLTDADLEAKVLAKYPEYGDLPTSKSSTTATPLGDAPPPIEKGLGERVGHQLGLTARAGVEGAAALPAAAGGIANTLLNLGIDRYNEMTGSAIPKLKMPGEVLSRRLTDLGVAVPENPFEEAATAGARGMAGAAAGVAGAGALAPASAVGRGVAETLKAAPGAQITGGATGGAAADVVGQLGGGPLAQALAGVAGGIAPSLPSLGGAAGRAVMRSDPAEVAANIGTFEKAGAYPSAGQATEGRGAQATESLLSKVPLAAGRMHEQRLGQQADIGAKTGELAEGLYPGADPTSAGREIERGIGSFVKGFKSTANDLYDRVDQFVPPEQEVPVTGYKAALAKLTTPHPGAPASTGQLVQPKLKAMSEALESDLNPQLTGVPVQMASGQTFQISPELQRTLGVTALAKNTLPYTALKDLRSRVGGMLSTNELLSDIPKAQLKQIYGALSGDMENAALINDADAGYYGPAGGILSSALKSGQPVAPGILAQIKAQPGPALSAFNRANAYFKSGHERIEQLQKVADKLDYEKMFAAATTGAKDGASQIRLVMKSLPPEARDAVTATMIKRLGKATNANQNDAGGIFSSETFLTNWQKLSPEAKTQLFTDHEVRDSLNAIASVASKMRFGKRVFANPSGSSQGATQVGTTLGMVTSLLTGHVGLAAAGGAALGGANLGARLMTNPAFVRWLSHSATDTPEQLGIQLNVLAQTIADPQERADVEALAGRSISPVKKASGGPVSAAQLLRAARRFA